MKKEEQVSSMTFRKSLMMSIKSVLLEDIPFSLMALELVAVMDQAQCINIKRFLRL